MIGPYHFTYDLRVGAYLRSEQCKPHKTCLLEFFDEVQEKSADYETYYIVQPVTGGKQKRFYLTSACRHLIDIRGGMSGPAIVEDVWMGATAMAIKLWGERI